MEDYKLVKSEMAFKGRIISVNHDTIVLPDGREAVREIVKHGGAAAILPVDSDGNIILVRQYRHSARELALEIPAGCLEKNEAPEVCAVRELEEEVGVKTGKVTYMTKFYSSIGFCDEVIHLYLAEDLVETQQNFDEDEFITLEKYSLDEALNLITTGKIIDSKTILAILFYKSICL